MNVALIAAGGSSSRMGRDKLSIRLGSMTVLETTLLTFDSCSLIDKIILATNNLDLINSAKALVSKPISFADAGEQRQYSVRNGLSLVDDEDIVLIHDAARPFVTSDLIVRCIESAKNFGSGVAAVPVYDSLKRADENMSVIKSIDRTGVFAMQTPQAFLGSIIKQAHMQDAFGTDDGYLVEQMGKEVRLVMGEKENIKLTTKEDIPKGEIRIGQGYDVHKLVDGRKLILCGIEVPYDKGLLGHSDADVATHALMDAMLGSIGANDIGRMFPDSDSSLEGASSINLLKQVRDYVYKRGYKVSNCDVTIIAQRPKLLPYIDTMRAEIARCIGVHISRINIKATTTEGLGFEGKGQGISAMAVVMIKGI